MNKAVQKLIAYRPAGYQLTTSPEDQEEVNSGHMPVEVLPFPGTLIPSVVQVMTAMYTEEPFYADRWVYLGTIADTTEHEGIAEFRGILPSQAHSEGVEVWPCGKIGSALQ